MNIHLPAILMFTRGTRFWHTAICWNDLPSCRSCRSCRWFACWMTWAFQEIPPCAPWRWWNVWRTKGCRGGSAVADHGQEMSDVIKPAGNSGKVGGLNQLTADKNHLLPWFLPWCTYTLTNSVQHFWGILSSSAQCWLRWPTLPKLSGLNWKWTENTQRRCTICGMEVLFFLGSCHCWLCLNIPLLPLLVFFLTNFWWSPGFAAELQQVHTSSGASAERSLVRVSGVRYSHFCCGSKLSKQVKFRVPKNKTEQIRIVFLHVHHVHLTRSKAIEVFSRS